MTPPLPTFITVTCDRPGCDTEIRVQESSIPHRLATYGGIHCHPCILRTSSGNPLRR